VINETRINAWAALAALCMGFFIVTVDVTIVAVANPVIMNNLHTDISSVMWVTSAYGLTYSVPLLATGRLGDRFSPKNIYLVGLAVFTLTSLWCGFATSVGMLIAALTSQGFGAAMLMPQTMAIITRIFPPAKRGTALGVWGAIAGVAALLGPIVGGILVDWLGWKSIFLVNLPVGGVGLLLAALFVPRLETHDHRFDFPASCSAQLGCSCSYSAYSRATHTTGRPLSGRLLSRVSWCSQFSSTTSPATPGNHWSRWTSSESGISPCPTLPLMPLRAQSPR
jgi:MFS family permease